MVSCAFVSIPRAARPGSLRPYPSAAHNNSQRYGRYSIRFRSDSMPGYKLAFLLWPDSEVWPGDGEIDFAEADAGGRICAFLHHRGATTGSDQDQFCTNAMSDAWHTATIEWSPGAVTFLLDGVAIGESTRSIPDTPMHWVLQPETSLQGPPPAPTAAGDVEIDWVSIDALAEAS